MTTPVGGADFTATRIQSGSTYPRIYGEALLELARERPEIVCLSADLTSSTEIDLFRAAFPERFYNLGIAEANAVGVAAGMARCGDIPFFHTFSVFTSRRPFDQIAMQLAYPRANVKLVGFLPGLTTLLGVSHQAIEDLAILRALPNMTLIEPSGPEQLRAAVRAAAEHHGPVYLRMRRAEARPAREVPLTIGRGELRRDGSDGVFFACGLMVEVALAAADILAQHGRAVAVVNLPTLKPLDRELVITQARRCGVVVTAENHTIVGGLGSAVAETLMEAGVSAGFARVGIPDTFAEGGSTPYLLKKYGLTAEALVAAFQHAEDTGGHPSRRK
jgi:transketolase